MIEELGNLVTALNLLKDAFKLALRQKGVVQTKEFQRKIVSFQFLLLEIVEKAGRIFELINSAKGADVPHKLISDIKHLAYSQNHSLYKLITLVEDEDFYRVVDLLKPNLRTIVHHQLHSKRARINLLMRVDDLDKKQLTEIYNQEYLGKGVGLIEELKTCSEEMATLIRDHIKINDLVSLSKKEK